MLPLYTVNHLSFTFQGPTLGGLNMGGMDFSALLSNPALMNMVGTLQFSKIW